jgi:hypothetical protein
MVLCRRSGTRRGAWALLDENAQVILGYELRIQNSSERNQPGAQKLA